MNEEQTNTDAEYAALWAEYQSALRALRSIAANLSLAENWTEDELSVASGYSKLAKDTVEAAILRADDFKGLNSCDALRIVDGVPEDNGGE
jgi:hypothetical protein